MALGSIIKLVVLPFLIANGHYHLKKHIDNDGSTCQLSICKLTAFCVLFIPEFVIKFRLIINV